MAGSVNKVLLVGNLGRDPEIRRTSTGDKLANLNIATSETWTKDGERREKTEWHRVVIYDERLADVAEKYLKKGSKVFLQGQLQTRKWDKNGETHYATEIVLNRFRGELVLLDARGERDSGPVADNTSMGRDELDDEIPF